MDAKRFPAQPGASHPQPPDQGDCQPQRAARTRTKPKRLICGSEAESEVPLRRQAAEHLSAKLIIGHQADDPDSLGNVAGRVLQARQIRLVRAHRLGNPDRLLLQQLGLPGALSAAPLPVFLHGNLLLGQPIKVGVYLARDGAHEARLPSISVRRVILFGRMML